METGLAGLGVVVTGASGGIGAACARAFAAEGARVLVHFHRGEERARALAAELGGAPVGQADLTREADADRLFADARDTLGRVDVCAAVAGVYPADDAPVWELALERFERFHCVGSLRLLRIELVVTTGPIMREHVVADDGTETVPDDDDAIVTVRRVEGFEKFDARFADAAPAFDVAGRDVQVAGGIAGHLFEDKSADECPEEGGGNGGEGFQTGRDLVRRPVKGYQRNDDQEREPD